MDCCSLATTCAAIFSSPTTVAFCVRLGLRRALACHDMISSVAGTSRIRDDQALGRLQVKQLVHDMSQTLLRRILEDRSEKAIPISSMSLATSNASIGIPPRGLMFVRCVAVMKSGCGIKSEKGLGKRFQARVAISLRCAGCQSKSTMKMRPFNSVQLSCQRV